MFTSFSRDRKTPILCRLDGQNLEDYEGVTAEVDEIFDCLLCAVCPKTPDILSSWKFFPVAICMFSFYNKYIFICHLFVNLK
jgi:hypothetical protein